MRQAFNAHLRKHATVAPIAHLPPNRDARRDLGRMLASTGVCPT